MAKNQGLSESDTIILSLHERWWRRMLSGEKLLEIRKTKPAGKGPFRVLVYVTGTGGIQGEFTCNSFQEIRSIQSLILKKGERVWDVQKQSCLTKQQIEEYKGDSEKPLWGWSVSEVKEFYTPHPLSLYGLKKPPQSWQYYKGEEVPDIMTINDLANTCGHFFNAEFDPETKCGGVNNGYNCRHEGQQEKYGGIGCCYQWSCPLENVVPADEEDCEKYGLDYEESEFVLVYRGGKQDG